MVQPRQQRHWAPSLLLLPPASCHCCCSQFLLGLLLLQASWHNVPHCRPPDQQCPCVASCWRCHWCCHCSAVDIAGLAHALLLLVTQLAASQDCHPHGLQCCLSCADLTCLLQQPLLIPQQLLRPVGAGSLACEGHTCCCHIAAAWTAVCAVVVLAAAVVAVCC